MIEMMCSIIEKVGFNVIVSLLTLKPSSEIYCSEEEQLAGAVVLRLQFYYSAGFSVIRTAVHRTIDDYCRYFV